MKTASLFHTMETRQKSKLLAANLNSNCITKIICGTELAENILEQELSDTGCGWWTHPLGGYFISLYTLDGCARHAYNLAASAGVMLTKVGATYPYGNDLRDSNIRIAPTFPSDEELTLAMQVLTV